MDVDMWGISSGYSAGDGSWVETTAETATKLRRAMSAGLDHAADEHSGPPSGPPMWFVRRGEAHDLWRPATITLEDGTTRLAQDSLPTDLPIGYHDLAPDDGGPVTRLVVAPDECPLPSEDRSWALTVQLYAARSHASWGMGDLADLGTISSWAAKAGAGAIAVSPLHAPGPGLTQQPSPYYPSSRRFANPLHIRIEDVPGADDVPAAIDAWRSVAQRVWDEDESTQRLIDRDRIYAAKMGALDELWQRFTGDPAFDRYLDDQGRALYLHAMHSVLNEVHGGTWQTWPVEHRRADSPALIAFSAEHGERIRFHTWIQWIFDGQLREAAQAGVPLITDLAVGVDRSGADAWANPDVFAADVSVGAPPDLFNPAGQDWGLPPFIPWQLRAMRYEPFIQIIRSALRHAGGVRVDHVMGMFRLFWIPAGDGPAQGAYVHYNADEMLDIIAIECERAGAFVIGEDLGTVSPGVRETLAERRILSYRLLPFEGEPEHIPEQSLAAVTTHDLPTIAGAWTGDDLAEQLARDIPTDTDAVAHHRQRLAELAEIAPDATVQDAVDGLHRALARTPALLITTSLDDLDAVAERPNMPGTVDAYPNWSLALPRSLDDLLTDETILRRAELLRRLV